MNIRDLSKARIVVVGDAMLDVWVHGRVERISPEAPVPVFVEERSEEKWGGAANVITNLRALGCETRGAFKDYGFWPIKTRFVINNQQMGLRHDLENFVPQADEDNLFATATSIECDVLILSDYAKGVCTPSLCQRLIQWAKAKGIKVVVDPRGTDWSKYCGAFILTPNLAEWALGGRGKRRVSEHLLTTSGADGMLLTILDHTGINIPATNTGPVDVTGAGDSVVAILAAAIAVGYDLETAARLANAGAGIVVGRFGTATCTIEELEEAYARAYGSVQESDPRQERHQTNQEWHNMGAPIVGIANGVFDLLHDGHRHFLRECKMNCDRLFVLINGDEYVRGYKGTYPHDRFRVRMKNVQEHADNVCGFDSESLLLELMQNIKPDVIFKGEDYRDKPVTGSDLARIHWVARHPGYSSTIERQKKLQPEPIAAEDM